MARGAAARARAIAPGARPRLPHAVAPPRHDDSLGADSALQRLVTTAGNRASVRALRANEGQPLQLHPAHPHRGPAQLENRYEVLGVRVPPPVGGWELPVQLRARLETSLNADLGNVRIHENPSAIDMDALAYTRGADVYMAPGHYQPHSGTGSRLLAHEMVHVIQQRANRVPSMPYPEGVAVNEDRDLEREADRLGRRALWGMPSTVRGSRDTVHHPTKAVAQPDRGLA